MLLLALFALGDRTQIEVILFVSNHPRCPRQVVGRVAMENCKHFLQKSLPIFLTTLVRKNFELTDETKILIKPIYDKHFELKTYFVVN